MNNKWHLDDRIESLMKKLTPPAVEDIVEIAKDYGATAAPQLWEVLDEVRRMWLEKRDSESLDEIM